MPQNTSQMSPDKAAAALALMTKLSEGLMPKQIPEEPTDATQSPETGPGEEMTQEVVEDPVEEVQPESTQEEPKEDKTSKEIETLVKDFESFKGEVKGIIETQIENLTKTLKDALK